MRIDKPGKSTRELRRMTHQLIYQVHDLERRGKRRYRPLSKMLAGQLAVVAMLKHLHSLYEKGSASDTGPTVEQAYRKYLQMFGGFVELVDCNSRTAQPLDKSTVASVLKSNTALFRVMAVNRVRLRPDATEWGKAVQAAVVAWGDCLRQQNHGRRSPLR